MRAQSSGWLVLLFVGLLVVAFLALFARNPPSAQIAQADTPTVDPTFETPFVPVTLEPSIEPTQPPPTLTLTETPTATTTETATATATAIATDSVTIVPPVETATALPTLETSPTLEAPIGRETATAMGEVSLTPINVVTQTPLIDTNATIVGGEIVMEPPTPTASLTPLPPEPTLLPVFQSLFNGDPYTTPYNFLGSEGLRSLMRNGEYGLWFTGMDWGVRLGPVPPQQDVIMFIYAEITGGELAVYTHGTGTTWYEMAVTYDGRVRLIRNGIELAATQIAFDTSIVHTLRVSAASGILRFSIDGTELLTYVDPAPLAPGHISIFGRNFVQGGGDIFVTGVTVFGNVPIPTIAPPPTSVNP